MEHTPDYLRGFADAKAAATLVCNRFENQWWEEYNTPGGDYQCSPHHEGMSDGASRCAIAIDKLQPKEAK